MTHKRQFDQWDAILSLGGVTVTFNERHNPLDMMESVFGYCDDFYSVFEELPNQSFNITERLWTSGIKCIALVTSQNLILTY